MRVKDYTYVYTYNDRTGECFLGNEEEETVTNTSFPAVYVVNADHCHGVSLSECGDFGVKTIVPTEFLC